MSDLRPGGDRERRASERVRVRLDVAIHIAPRVVGGHTKVVTGELVDVARDGRGAAVWVTSDREVPIGGAVQLRFGSGVDIPGIVVSRLGLRGGSRLGVRVDLEGQARLCALAIPPSATL